ANGANDNFKGVASLYGSGAASYRTSLVWATIATFAGSVCALYWAQTLLITFSGKGLAPDFLIQTVPFMASVAAGAGMTVILATRFGFPVSTTHALLGAIAGSSLAATRGSLDLNALGNNFILPLLLSPVLALGLAIVIYFSLKMVGRRMKTEEPLCLCVENEVSGTVLARLESAAITLPRESFLTFRLAGQSTCDTRYAGVILGLQVRQVFEAVHFISAGAVCFARGLNDTPKIAALLLLAPAFDRQGMILLVAVMIGLGGILNARRVAETMSYGITAMSQGQGLAANLTTSLLVIFASKFGIPVSTTHVSVGALFGIGLMTGRSHAGTIVSIMLSWLLTLPCGALLAAGIFSLNRLLSEWAIMD
ncbi:MAG: inorganic phosphate transporter, partial [Methylosarcina sp.]